MTLGPQEPQIEQDVMAPGMEQGCTATARDVIDILLEQHEWIRDLLADVQSGGPGKQWAFDDLRDLLAAHEEGEEAVLRPVTRRVASDDVASARNWEEEQADELLAALARLDIGSAEFDSMFSDFRSAVAAHAAHEEAEEFPRIRAGVARAQLVAMAQELLAVE